jgi:hypothetical protein
VEYVLIGLNLVLLQATHIAFWRTYGILTSGWRQGLSSPSYQELTGLLATKPAKPTKLLMMEAAAEKR